MIVAVNKSDQRVDKHIKNIIEENLLDREVKINELDEHFHKIDF
jgi:AraC-like DNA-binding protein